MANAILKPQDDWVDIEEFLGVTLEADKTYVIGSDSIARIYAKATEPDKLEGYLFSRQCAYTHKSGNKLWVKAVQEANIVI